MPGYIWLGILKHVLDVTNTEFPVQQQIHDPQPARIPQCFEDRFHFHHGAICFSHGASNVRMSVLQRRENNCSLFPGSTGLTEEYHRVPNAGGNLWPPKFIPFSQSKFYYVYLCRRIDQFSFESD